MTCDWIFNYEQKLNSDLTSCILNYNKSITYFYVNIGSTSKMELPPNDATHCCIAEHPDYWKNKCCKLKSLRNGQGAVCKRYKFTSLQDCEEKCSTKKCPWPFPSPPSVRY